MNTSQAENLVSIQNLYFGYEDFVIFDGINVEVKQGSITGVMGPSGTGKSTLLRLIGAQLTPDSGYIAVAGEDIHSLNRTKLFEMRAKIGMLFQSGALFTDLSVFENVAFPLRLHTNLSERMILDMVLMKLEAVGLRGAKNLMPSELSGGMARRVALARAVILDPHLVMYDEPFVGQDPIAKGMLVSLIQQLNQALGLTSLLVSHDIEEMFELCDYLYLISAGKVVAKGHPEELKHSSDLWVRQFVEGLPDGPVPFHYQSATAYHQELMQG